MVLRTMTNPSTGTDQSAASRPAPHSGEIDSLRAFAMTAVVAMHCQLLPFGWVGVWLFFVISGYVVTQSINNRGTDEAGLPRLSNFLRRRAIRIWPVYYLFVIIGVGFALAKGYAPNLPAISSLFFFYHNIAMIDGFGEMPGWQVAHLWTISVEMQFYLIYGAVACLCSRRITVAILILFVFAAPVARAVTSSVLAARGWQPEALAYAIYSGPGLHFDSFAMGALLALARNKWSIQSLSRYLVPIGFLAFTAYCLVYAIVGVSTGERQGFDQLRDIISGILYGQGREVILYTCLALLSLALVLLALTRSRASQWLLGSAILQWVGRISYGAYVYHTIAIAIISATFMERWGGISHSPIPMRLVGFGMAFALTLILAQISFRYLETPIGRYFNRRRRAASGAVLAPSPAGVPGLPPHL